MADAPKDTKEGRKWRLFGRLRLRHKLAISLSIAALLPVILASWVAVSVVLRSLDKGLRDETDRQLAVGLNLLVRQVERLGHEAVRLSSASDLSYAMNSGREEISQFLARASPHLPSSLVQITDEHGDIVAERVIGGVQGRFAGLHATPISPLVKAGLGLERRVTIIRVGELLVVRASAPIVDASYGLQGVVVLTVPMDGEFADAVKSALGTDVLIFVGQGEGTETAMSTFLDRNGARVGGIGVTPGIAERVKGGEGVLVNDTIRGREYAIGYTPLKDLDGDNVGLFAVAVDRAPLLSAKAAATRSLALGAAGAFVFALGLAGLLSRRITRPIGRLHRGAIAIARGDLDHQISVSEGDEIGDLATAFSHMTRALKDNQARLAARMREIVALHDAGRAVSSVINLSQVLRKIVDSVARVFDVRLCALWVVDTHREGVPLEASLRLGATRAKGTDLRRTLRGEEGAELAAPLAGIARDVATHRATLRVDRVAEDERRRDAAIASGITGSLLATPLERKGVVVGVIIVGRTRDAKPFADSDSNLLATFADQAAAAVENARLYEEVREFSEELEEKVRLRTKELEAINAQLGRTITELRETQAQLILSERLAGLGLLVAGVAHEINSPTAAIRGSVDAVGDNVHRLTEMSRQLAALDLGPEARDRFGALVVDVAPGLASQRVLAPAKVRRAARELRTRFEAAGIGPGVAANTARGLAEMGAGPELVDQLLPLIESTTNGGQTDSGERASVLVGYLTEYVYLHRNALTIQNAINRIQRIVGALRSYAHSDKQAAIFEADIHEGIEDTLAILDYVLRGIVVTRRFGDIPRIEVYQDELNQVWTNLIHNAVQALQGRGSIVLETSVEGQGVVVRVIDDGPGIPENVQARIFEPFFTTKPKGEGTGLGLGIVRQIVEKHRGTVSCTSKPGQTCFEVWLPSKQRTEVEEQPSGDRSTGAATGELSN